MENWTENILLFEYSPVQKENVDLEIQSLWLIEVIASHTFNFIYTFHEAPTD